ncbi:MAG: hypothetical protein WC777_00835 [Candidatus Gracilibacteria bacterium]|jgi:hypothetical protein
MKILLSLGLFALLLTGCASTETDMEEFEREANDLEEYFRTLEENEEEAVEDEEIPDSPGPSEIPDDLIPSR